MEVIKCLKKYFQYSRTHDTWISQLIDWIGLVADAMKEEEKMRAKFCAQAN